MLPLAAASASRERPRFRTRQTRLPRAQWNELKHTCRQWGATPSAVLLALFAHTLERWSRHAAFTLNLTFFNRRPDHPQVAQLIGDFTSVLLIDFALDRSQTLRDTIERTQRRLWQRLAHSQVNGVELIRELARERVHDPRQPLMPIVFTSMLGMSLDGLGIDQAMTRVFGEPTHVFTQTPQVWLDHQIMEIDGDLVCSWYCMDDVFAPGIAQAMFDDYENLLRGVAACPKRLTEAGPVALCGNGARDDLPRWHWPAGPDDAALDLRDVEAALRACAPVGDALAALDPDGRALDITVSRAVTHDASAMAATPLQLGTPLPMPNAPALDEIDITWRWLEARALHGIAGTLCRHGLFVRTGQRHDLDAVQSCLRALPTYRRLVRQWLLALTGRGWLLSLIHI